MWGEREGRESKREQERDRVWGERDGSRGKIWVPSAALG